MSLDGKGFYIWRIENCDGGDPLAIASAARNADLSHVLIKVANATRTYNFDEERGIDLVPPVASALRAEGIQVWGWQYIYGEDPLGEARKALQRVQELELDGFVVNAENEFKESGKDVSARTYMRELRNSLQDIPIGLSTYRFPAIHPQFPYSDFLRFCDINLPQVYWMGATNPEAQLIKSMRQYQNIDPVRPMIPTGFAFSEYGYEPNLGEPSRFLDTAKELNMSAANFWSWDNCRQRIPDIWDEIRDYPWPSLAPQKDITQRYIDALNTRDPVQVAALYNEDGVHVNATRTVRGLAGLLGWYNTLFNEILPNATFTLTGFSGSGNSRHMTWSAESSVGPVQNGNDTFGLQNDKIGYHYTFFTTI
ncbi:MAG: nuclear transport factor 2 family protein [Chloroflexi bacterium]|nr:nuclear transport factor 2 family protein [Chloroflexota bacterium]